MKTQFKNAVCFYRWVALYWRCSHVSLDEFGDHWWLAGRLDLWLLYGVLLRVPLALFMALYLAEEEMREESTVAD